MEIEYIYHLQNRDTKSKDTHITPVATFDTIEEFEKALEEGYFNRTTNNENEPMPIKEIKDSNALSLPTPLRASGFGNLHLTQINSVFGTDLYATVSYNYNTVNGVRHYTSFTNFVPYISGVNIGYSFQLTTWSGTPCSSIRFDNGQWYYTVASSGPYYYIQWADRCRGE